MTSKPPRSELDRPAKCASKWRESWGRDLVAYTVPERHLVSSLIAKFNIKLRTRIIDQLADSPLVLVIDESTSGLDSMREKPAVMATVGLNLDDGSCALLDEQAPPPAPPTRSHAHTYIHRQLCTAG